MEQLKNVLQKYHSMTSKSTNRLNLVYVREKKSERILKQNIISIGNSLVKDFVLSKELAHLFGQLFLYFTGNESEYDLNKGIYLYGQYGVGKSVTMNIFSKFLQQHFNFGANNFGITSIEEIAEYYKQTGNVLKYGRNYEESRIIAHNKCINEFGKPLDEKHYGTNIQNVINSMLMVRYELFQENKAITHATSNYHPSELTCFDDALLDRFREMFNFIKLDGNSFRK